MCVFGRSLFATDARCISNVWNCCKAIRRDFWPFLIYIDVLADSRLELVSAVLVLADSRLELVSAVLDVRSRCRLVLVST